MAKSLTNSQNIELSFKTKCRLHQNWWREHILNEKEGLYWDAKNKKMSSVGNRINNGETSLKNFISKEIADLAKQAVEINKIEKSGMIDEDRLYNNLLSSQPLAFNFFGFLKTNPDVAIAFFKTIIPEISTLEDIMFEFAPDTSDHSAFDVAIKVGAGSKRGYIGFECKYTDTFSYRRKGSKVNYGDKSGVSEDKNYSSYFQIYSENPERFPNDYFSYVRNPEFNQLFRNELLALQIKPKPDFIITGLFCHHDDDNATKAGLNFQMKVGNHKDDFILLTYADFFDRIQKINLSWQQREYIMLLWSRYCGLELSKEFHNS